MRDERLLRSGDVRVVEWFCAASAVKFRPPGPIFCAERAVEYAGSATESPPTRFFIAIDYAALSIVGVGYRWHGGE